MPDRRRRRKRKRRRAVDCMAVSVFYLAYKFFLLRRIFGPKRDEVTGEWRRLHNKELYALYSSPNIIRVMK
jgi:hypothetical protein